ncbi:MAG TPA: diacylglycerol kinase family protein [Stellaceae bacterium]|jgi:diacylglycerol kinase family enzyme|nr:diacylglycerol kinase family protein [Stellaceae bacterium]
MDKNEGRARRLLVIYNPTSGRRKRRKLERFLFHLEALGARATLCETTAPRHAETIARAADPALVDAVLVAGGDGTINEALNGLAGSPLPLAVLPLGTANVLANEIGLPRRAAALARMAAFGPARPVWPGEAISDSGVRRFLVMAGIGFDAAVVEHLDLALKRRTGKLAYVASILGRLRDYRPCFYRGEVDGRPVMGASLVAAKAHFYGGRFVLAPAARLDEPSLHLVVFDDAGRRAALGYMAAMSLGILRHCRSLRVVPGKSVWLIEPAGAAVQLDGDIQLRLPTRLGIARTPQLLVMP